jgi:hypothetical protein
MLDRRAATLNTVSPPLRDSYAATIMPLPRCQIPILTVAGLIQIAALQTRIERRERLLMRHSDALIQRLRYSNNNYECRCASVAETIG